MNETVRSILVNGVVILLASLLLFAASTWWRLESQYSLGEQALKRNDFAGAVAGFESALHMYIPFHPTVGKAAEQLWKVGEQNERLGDANRALIAYRALRSSFYADHWLVTPGREWIERCDRRIAALVPLVRER